MCAFTLGCSLSFFFYLDWVVGWLYDILSCLLTSWGVCASATDLSFFSKWRPQRSEGSLNEEWGCRIDIGFKGWKFKCLRGLPLTTVTQMLLDVAERKSSLKKIAADCQSIKDLQKVQTAFLKCTNTSSWEEAEIKYPKYVCTEKQYIKHAALHRGTIDEA